jgi:hypothetical protein
MTLEILIEDTELIFFIQFWLQKFVFVARTSIFILKLADYE